jgi:hypothetical protein
MRRSGVILVLSVCLILTWVGAVFSQNCEIQWWGARNGSVPTNETSKTEIATYEAYSAIVGMEPGVCGEYGSPYCCGCIPPILCIVEVIYYEVYQDGYWRHFSNCRGTLFDGYWDVVCQEPSLSVTIRCPNDTTIGPFTLDPFVPITGFKITNTSDISLSFEYNLVAEGPVHLVDNGNPESISGTTPLLSPGESYIPPEPALQLVVLTEYDEETITHHVSAVGHPEVTESCVMTVALDPPIATLLQDCTVHIDDLNVIIRWTLSELPENIEFFVMRSGETTEDFVELPNTGINRKGFSFIFRDDNTEPGGTYQYRIEVQDSEDRRLLFETDLIFIPPLSLILYQNYPNPFNPATTIKYYLQESCYVTLEIYDVSGKRVARLVDKEQAEGLHAIDWNGVDDHDKTVTTGMYLCVLTAGKQAISKKILLLK